MGVGVSFLLGAGDWVFVGAGLAVGEGLRVGAAVGVVIGAMVGGAVGDAIAGACVAVDVLDSWNPKSESDIAFWEIDR